MSCWKTTAVSRKTLWRKAIPEMKRAAYTFEAEEGFTTALKVLGTPIKEGRIFQLPSQVSEDEDKPLEVKVSLPNSNGENEEFFVSVR